MINFRADLTDNTVRKGYTTHYQSFFQDSWTLTWVAVQHLEFLSRIILTSTYPRNVNRVTGAGQRFCFSRKIDAVTIK